MSCTTIATHNPDIILVSETWLSAAIASSDFLPGGYIAYHRDRPYDYGEIIIAHKWSIPSHQLSITDSNCELMVIVS